MSWGGLKGALGRITGSAPPAGAPHVASSGDDLASLRAALRADDVDARVRTIESLGELAARSVERHWAVMEILVAFVRDRAPWLAREESGAPERDVQRVIHVLKERRWTETERLPLGLFQVDLRNADFSGARLERADFSRSHLDGADFTGARLNEANFQEAFLDDARLAKADLGGANLFAADLARADFTGAALSGVNLQEASLEGARLAGARLDGADFRGALLTGTHLEGADLSQCVGLTREQLASARSDAGTIPPKLG